MSRLAKRPIRVPDNVKIEFRQTEVYVEGPRGALTVPFDPRFRFHYENGEIRIERPSDEKEDKAKHGLYWKLLVNAITGVTEGFRKELEVIGVGYRAQLKGKQVLELSLGYSHPIYFVLPPEISAHVEATREKTTIRIEGIDRALVGEVAAKIRALRKPNVYTGKGIRYAGEYVRRKPGKAAVKR